MHIHTFGAARVPMTQAAVPSSCSTLTEAELPQVKKKKSYVYAHGSFFSHIPLEGMMLKLKLQYFGHLM